MRVQSSVKQFSKKQLQLEIASLNCVVLGKTDLLGANKSKQWVEKNAVD